MLPFMNSDGLKETLKFDAIESAACTFVYGFLKGQ